MFSIFYYDILHTKLMFMVENIIFLLFQKDLSFNLIIFMFKNKDKLKLTAKKAKVSI